MNGSATCPQLLVQAAASVAVKLTVVKPVALALNVAWPVPELLAVIVTFCAVEKFVGVKVSEAPADTDRPVFPDARATATVTFEVGADDSDIPTVPVPP